MSLSYCLIQYIDDPIRNEGRNIGVIVLGFGRACFRALGVSGAGVDVTSFEAIARKKAVGWIYREWIGWFNDVLAGDGKSLDTIFAIARKLEGGNIVIRDGGEIDAAKEGYLDDAADALFTRLVRCPNPQTAGRFSERIDVFIKRSEICYLSGFDKDISVEFLPPGGTPVSVAIPFAMIDKPRTIFKLVNSNGSIESLLRQINDAVFTFETVVANGFAERNRCVVITDRPGATKAPYFTRLATHAQIVYLSESDSTSKVRDIIEKGVIRT
jgi:hypothetical protein